MPDFVTAAPSGIIRLLLAAFLVSLFAGCGGSRPKPKPQDGESQAKAQPQPQATTDKTPPASNAAAKALETVDLALDWFPEAEFGGYYAAEVHGFYEEEGLDVRLLPGGPDAPVIPRVALGKVTFGTSSADNLLIGRAQQAPVVCVMAPLQQSPRCIMVHEKSGITRFEDLKNLTLAMSSKAAFFHYLKKKYVLENVQIVPYPGNVTQFLLNDNCAQQGYVFSEPFLAREKGAKPRSLMVSHAGFNPYAVILVTNESTIKEKPDLVRRMVRASVKGWQRYLESPGESNEFIRKLNPELSVEILEYGAAALKPLVLDEVAKEKGIGVMTLERWRQLHNQLVEVEVIKPGAVEVEKSFTVDFLPPKEAE